MQGFPAFFPSLDGCWSNHPQQYSQFIAKGASSGMGTAKIECLKPKKLQIVDSQDDCLLAKPSFSTNNSHHFLPFLFRTMSVCIAISESKIDTKTSVFSLGIVWLITIMSCHKIETPQVPRSPNLMLHLSNSPRLGNPQVLSKQNFQRACQHSS